MTSEEYAVMRARRDEQYAAKRHREANMERLRRDKMNPNYRRDRERNLEGIARARAVLRGAP